MEMKYLLFFLLFAVEVNGQETRYKTYEDSTGMYLIKYDVDFSSAFVPMTYPPGAPHYDATITVYQIYHWVDKSKDTVLNGASFPGTYVKDGCFEDRPEDHIRKAKGMKSNRVVDWRDEGILPFRTRYIGKDAKINQ
jgi:hypothetical protein